MDDVEQSKAAVHLAMLINLLSIGSLMMVMPLGPDLVRDLGMQASHVGYISGGATLASALSMALAAPWLDRLKRKQALVILLTLRFALLIQKELRQELNADERLELDRLRAEDPAQDALFRDLTKLLMGAPMMAMSLWLLM